MQSHSSLTPTPTGRDTGIDLTFAKRNHFILDRVAWALATRLASMRKSLTRSFWVIISFLRIAAISAAEASIRLMPLTAPSLRADCWRSLANARTESPFTYQVSTISFCRSAGNLSHAFLLITGTYCKND